MAMFGQDNSFFDLLERQADAAVDASNCLCALTADLSGASAAAEKLSRIEANADKLTHELVAKADAKFITPLDKDDLHYLAGALDNITDHIEAAAARVVIYRLSDMRSDVAELIQLLHATVETVASAVRELRRLKSRNIELHTLLIRVHELEGESDTSYRAALVSLFDGTLDHSPVLMMKWKDIYDRIEVAVDACEDVADLLEGIAVKYA